MLKRILWLLGGVCVGEILVLGFRRLAGIPRFPDIAFVAGGLLVAWGERTGHLEKFESLNGKPVTIFDGKVPRT